MEFKLKTIHFQLPMNALPFLTFYRISILSGTCVRQSGLNKLKTNDKSQIVFKEDRIESFSYVEAEHIRQWMIVFANMCHKIVKNINDDRGLFSNTPFA